MANIASEVAEGKSASDDVDEGSYARPSPPSLEIVETFREPRHETFEWAPVGPRPLGGDKDRRQASVDRLVNRKTKAFEIGETARIALASMARNAELAVTELVLGMVAHTIEDIVFDETRRSVTDHVERIERLFSSLPTLDAVAMLVDRPGTTSIGMTRIAREYRADMAQKGADEEGAEDEDEEPVAKRFALRRIAHIKAALARCQSVLDLGDDTAIGDYEKGVL